MKKVICSLLATAFVVIGMTAMAERIDSSVTKGAIVVSVVEGCSNQVGQKCGN